MFGLFLYAGIWYNIFMKNTEIPREKFNQMSSDEVFSLLQQMQTEMDKMHEENEHLNERISNLLTLLYGRSTEKKLPADPRYEQLSMLLNEAESDYSEDTEEPEFDGLINTGYFKFFSIVSTISSKLDFVSLKLESTYIYLSLYFLI